VAYKTQASDRVESELLAVHVQYPSFDRISFLSSSIVVLVFLSLTFVLIVVLHCRRMP
jgi:hypothetical protein